MTIQNNTAAAKALLVVVFAVASFVSASVIAPSVAFADCPYGQFCDQYAVTYDDSSDWTWEPDQVTYNTYDTYNPNDWYWEPDQVTYNTYDVYEPVAQSYELPFSYELPYSYELPSQTYSSYGCGYSCGSTPTYYSNISYAYPSYSYPSYNNSGYSYDYVYESAYDYEVIRDRDHDDSDLECEIDASDTSVEEGDRITLEWDTRDADYASINQGIGRVDEDGGTERVTIDDNDDVTFRLTVRNDDDEETCSVTVRVDEDEENDFSSVTFYGEPTNNPPTVYLSSLPYTGLEDIAPETYAYILLLLSGAGALGYTFVMKGGLAAFAFAVPSATFRSEDEAVEEADVAPEAVDAFINALLRNDQDAVVDALRDAAVAGQGVEEFLDEVRAANTDEALASRLDVAAAAAAKTGIRGAKEALIA